MTTPCKQGNPEDWFIERDGLQYHDEPFVILPELVDEQWTTPFTYEYVEKQLRAEMRAAALLRRRQAKDACYSCPVRLECLTIAMETRPGYGTWGGYLHEQLRKIWSAQDKRRERRHAPEG